MSRNPNTSISALLTHYSFDLNGYPLEEVVKGWLDEYPPKWVIAAVVEAIFQGRYKAASVDNILLNWYLSGKPHHHFDSEFADIVCSKLFKTIPPENQTQPKPLEKTFLTVLDVPFKETLNQETAPKEPYSFSHSNSSPKILNKGIEKWLKFVTKL